jgi:hypothetical protein
MAQEIRRFSRDDDTADIVKEVRLNGVAIIENQFEPEVMDLLRGKLEADLDAEEPGGGAGFGNKKRSVGALFARGREFSEHLLESERGLQIADAILLPAVPMAAGSQRIPLNSLSAGDRGEFYSRPPDPLVGPNCHHYRINATVAMQVCRGGTNQPLHRDEYRYLPFMHRDPNGPELTVSNMVAATDFTAENGATRFIPGSNRWPRDRKPEEHEVVQAVMPKGSVASFLGSVFHGLGTSRVDEPRTGFIYSFALDHLAQEENQFLSVPPEIARTLSLRARQLLGYRASPSINWVVGFDQDDVLKPGKTSLLDRGDTNQL